MLRPTDIESLKGDKSRYAIVVGVAKRARDIAEEAEREGAMLEEKPVSLAIEDLTRGDYKILMNETVDEDDESNAADADDADVADNADEAADADDAEVAEEEPAE